MADLTTGPQPTTVGEGGPENVRMANEIREFAARTPVEDEAERAERLRLLSKELMRGSDDAPPPPRNRYTPVEWAQKKARRKMARQSRRKQR